jgi:hypothetical protein
MEKQFNTSIGKSGCHIMNVAELLMKIDVQFYDENEKTIKVPLEKVPLLAGIVWSKLKETFEECEGKEIVIDFGDSPTSNAIESFLKFLLDMLPQADAKVDA